MYGIYANIWGISMVNVTIYSIHGSYGYGYGKMKAMFQTTNQSFSEKDHWIHSLLSLHQLDLTLDLAYGARSLPVRPKAIAKLPPATSDMRDLYSLPSSWHEGWKFTPIFWNNQPMIIYIIIYNII